jgi:hypothetical protein
MKTSDDSTREQQPHTMTHKVHNREIDHRVRDAHDVLAQIVKAVKTFSIYMHNPDSVETFVKSAHGTLSAFLAANDILQLIISGGTIKYMGEEIYREESDQLSFAYKFNRDGIRKIVFMRGVTLDEFREFAKIAAMCSQGAVSASVDIVSLLWKVAFIHIEYTVVEGLAPLLGSTGLDEKTMEKEVMRVAERISTRLVGSGPAIPAFSRDEVIVDTRGGLAFDEDLVSKGLDFDVAGIEPIGEIAAQADLVPENVKEAAARELEGGEEELILSKLLKILVVLVRHGFDDREREDITENVLMAMDMLLAAGNLKGIAILFKKIEELASAPGGQPEIRERLVQLRQALVTGFGSEARLEKIRLLLCAQPVEDSDSLVTILLNIDEQALRMLPAMIEHISVPENVKAVCRAFHYKRPGLDYVARVFMRSANEQLVKEGLHSAALIEFEGKAESIRVLLDHPNRDIRFEALKAIATTPSEEGRKFIAKALEDQDRDILLAALDAVQKSEPGWVGRTLARLMNQPTFKHLPPEVQSRFFKAAALTNTPEVFSMFGEIMTRKAGLFHRKEARQNRMMVVDALKSEPSLVTYKILNVYSIDTRVPQDIREICKTAMLDVRKAMVGE